MKIKRDASEDSLDTLGKALLRIIVEQIRCGRIVAGDPRSFLSYKEALSRLGEAFTHIFPGKRLQLLGLTAINEWTKTFRGLPHIGGLIVNKRSRKPSDGFPDSHGRLASGWEVWWMKEANKAIAFDWTPYI